MITIHPEDNLNVSNKCYGHPDNSSLKSTNVNLRGGGVGGGGMHPHQASSTAAVGRPSRPAVARRNEEPSLKQLRHLTTRRPTGVFEQTSSYGDLVLTLDCCEWKKKTSLLFGKVWEAAGDSNECYYCVFLSTVQSRFAGIKPVKQKKQCGYAAG